MDQSILDFYGQASGMTAAGRYQPRLRELPDSVDELVGIVQHLMVYDVVVSDFYGFTLPESRRNEIHLRPLEAMLEQLLALDDRTLPAPRPVDKRLAGRCRDFVLFLIALLRAKGIPARARCGFGTYFNPLYFEDHWVCEYWQADGRRWVLVDPQFDAVWRKQLNITHDVLDVPRDRFLVAAQAWNRCRRGEADPEKFGIEFAGVRGLWFIAGSLIRDLAALNKMEMLPWDVWGGQPQPYEPLDKDQLAFFDRLARLTLEPDACFAELCRLYESDERLRVPPTVFNAILNRPETV